MADLATEFPFQGAFVYREVRAADQVLLRMEDRPLQSVPSIGSFADEDLVYGQAMLENRVTPAQAGEAWYSEEVFSHIGPLVDGRVAWQELQTSIVNWLNRIVIGHLLQLNRQRILRGLAEAPTYNPERISEAVFVVLSDTALRQGTAFALADLGLITCAHVVLDAGGKVTPDLYALRSGTNAKRNRVRVVKASHAHDLAVLEAPGLRARPLERSGVLVSQLDQVLLAGYPNHNLGDTLSVRPAVVSGFRQWHGIRRVLVNAGIVAGMSGGPVLDAASAVVGVAVTGADSDGGVDATENHGFIPIDAIDHLV